MYISTLPPMSALDGVGGRRQASAALPLERPGTHCPYKVELKTKRGRETDRLKVSVAKH
jgi:hypothetical protein